MGNILQYIGNFIAMAVGCVGDFLAMITESFGERPSASSIVLTLFIVCVPLVGLGIGLLRRLIHTRG